MSRMTAMEAAIHVLREEGVEVVFGIPGAAILPFYEALKESGIGHVLMRHEEAATHAADGYSRASGKIGVAVGTSGPAGTNMVTGLYTAQADSVPILCLTGQAPRAKLHKEDFQAVDVVATARPVSKWAAIVMEGGQVPGAFRQAFHLMRSGRPGPVLLDFPIDVQLEQIDYDPLVDAPLGTWQPTPHQPALARALEMMAEAERPLIVAGGGVILAEASSALLELAELLQVPVVPTLMGWGAIPDDHPLHAGMVGLQTQHRYGNDSFLRSDFVLGVGNRWASRHTGTVDVYRSGRRFVHVDIDPLQIGRVFSPDLGIVADARAALEGMLREARQQKQAGKLPDWGGWAREVRERKEAGDRRTDFNETPIKPQRVFRELAAVFDRETRYVTAIGLYQIASGQYQRVYWPRQYLVCGQAGPLGWEIPAAIGAKMAEPEREVVAVAGDFSAQFLIEELAVAAQHRIPFVTVVLNNAYLGLIRQSEIKYGMNYEVALGFENANAPEGDPTRSGGYGVDHAAAARALGSLGYRVTDPEELAGVLEQARRESREQSLPALVEVFTERETNIAMGPEIDQIREFD